MRTRHLVTLLTGLLFVFATCITPPDASACVYSSKLRSFNRAKAKYLADPSSANLARMCRKQAAIAKKFKGAPGKPTPPLPPGAVCPPPGGGGGGRGGGPGGGGGAGGGGGGAGPVGMPGLGPYPGIVFIRNHNPFDCTFSWTITADPGNPAGFSVSPAVGSTLVPAGSTLTLPFDATIDPDVVPGECAFFDVDIIDDCNGLPLPDDFRRFKVAASDDVSITPDAASAVASDGVPFSISWTITNQSAAPVVKAYSFSALGDPQSVGELNSGTPYDIRNIFDMGPSPLGGGSVSLGPGESESVEWGPLVNGRYCDPEMLACCAIDIDGNASCIMIFNDDAGVDRAPEPFFDLVGEAQGGFVELQIEAFQLQVPTFPGQPIPQILDELALQMLNQGEVNPQFQYMPMVDETGMGILRAHEIPMNLFSADPGLNWLSFNMQPVISEGVTGEIHTVIVELTLSGNPIPGVPIGFGVDGANGPLGGPGVPTDGQGRAEFSYLGDNPGVDDIFANVAIDNFQGLSFLTEVVSRIWDTPSTVPTGSSSLTAVLHGAQPNPFAPSTQLSFNLSEEDHAVLRIYAPDGRTVRTLVDQRLSAGHHVVEWDGRDGKGLEVVSGVYYYDLEVGGVRESNRMVRLR